MMRKGNRRLPLLYILLRCQPHLRPLECIRYGDADFRRGHIQPRRSSSNHISSGHRKQNLRDVKYHIRLSGEKKVSQLPGIITIDDRLAVSYQWSCKHREWHISLVISSSLSVSHWRCDLPVPANIRAPACECVRRNLGTSIHKGKRDSGDCRCDKRGDYPKRLAAYPAPLGLLCIPIPMVTRPQELGNLKG